MLFSQVLLQLCVHQGIYCFYWCNASFEVWKLLVEWRMTVKHLLQSLDWLFFGEFIWNWGAWVSISMLSLLPQGLSKFDLLIFQPIVIHWALINKLLIFDDDLHVIWGLVLIMNLNEASGWLLLWILWLFNQLNQSLSWFSYHPWVFWWRICAFGHPWCYFWNLLSRHFWSFIFLWWLSRFWTDFFQKRFWLILSEYWAVDVIIGCIILLGVLFSVFNKPGDKLSKVADVVTHRILR